MLVFFIATTLPYRLAFARSWPPPLVYIDFLSDIYFILDIFLNTFTAYYDDDTLVTDRKAIVIHYLQTWFVLDAVATFPVDWVIEMAKGEDFDPLGDPFKNVADCAQVGRGTGGGDDVAQLQSLLRVLKIVKLLR